MSTFKINQPACVINCNCDDCNPSVNPDQKIIGSGATQGVSNEYLTDNFYTKSQVDIIALSGSTDLTDYYTKTQSNNRFQLIGDYVSASTINNFYTKLDSDNRYEPLGNYVSAITLNNYYTKNEADNEFVNSEEFHIALNGYQLAGDYLTGSTVISELPNDIGYITSASTAFDNKYLPISSGVAITNLSNDLHQNYYTKNNIDDDFASLDYLSLTLNSYQTLSQKNSANGYAGLTSAGLLPISLFPDRLLGNVRYKGTYNGLTNIISSADPVLNGQPLPTSDSGTTGYYFVSTVSYTLSGKTYDVGDWIISNGDAGWDKVDNADAVTTVFGRNGNIIANESDYVNFYPLLSSAYTNPSWISSIPNTKITYANSASNFVKGDGSITGLTSLDITNSLGYTPFDWTAFPTGRVIYSDLTTGMPTSNTRLTYNGSTFISNNTTNTFGASITGRNNANGVANMAGMVVYNDANSVGKVAGTHIRFAGKTVSTAAFGATLNNTNGVGTAIIAGSAGGNLITRAGFTQNQVYFGTSSSPSAAFYVGTTMIGTAASAIGRGAYINPTVRASANNDVLVGLDVVPSFVTSGAIATSTLTNGGSGYTDGTYLGVDLSGGAGDGAIADLIVSGGIITASTITQTGGGYAVNNTLSASADFDGVGLGSGLIITVNSILSYTGVTTYGLRSQIAASTSAYNLYLNGTAQNYFAGNIGIGTNLPTSPLHIFNTLNVDGASGTQIVVSGNGTNHVYYGQKIVANHTRTSTGTGSVYGLDISASRAGTGSATGYGLNTIFTNVGIMNSNAVGRYYGGSFILNGSTGSTATNQNYYGLQSVVNNSTAGAEAGIDYGIYSTVASVATKTTYGGYFSATGGGTNYGLYVANGDTNIQSLTASQAVFTDANKNLVSVANTGTGANVLADSPTFTGTLTASAPLNTGDTYSTLVRNNATGRFETITGTTSFDSPAFTGTPTAPTAANGTNTNQLATTAFVTNALSASTVYFASGFTGTGTSGSPITLTTDINPTLNSVNPITSGGIYNALLNKQGTLPTGTTTQYLAGDLTMKTFPTFGTGLTFSAASNLTNNLITGVAGGQTIVGGTGVTDAINLKGTTANGTATSAAMNFRVGNNGATTAMAILNSGNVGIGTGTTTYKLQLVGTARLDLGSDATGDLHYRASTGAFTRLPIGTAGQMLGIVSGLPAWVPVGYTPISTKTAAYTATVNDGTILVDCTTGSINITLPTVSTNSGQTLVIKKIDSTGNAVNIIGTVDGVTNPTITIQYNVMSIQSNGSAYYKV